MRARQLGPLAWIVVLVLVIVTGFTLSRTIKSPREAAATTAAPPSAVLTAKVERRALTSTLIERGAVVGDRALSVTPPLQAGSAQVQYLTAVRVTVGKQVRAGQLLLAVSGRPLIALVGQVPAYRDLAFGSTGPDVGQLQRALAAVGGVGADPADSFGAGTAAALQRVYARAGYRPVELGGHPGLPLAEVAFVPTLPATVTALNGQVGDLVKAPLISLQTGTLHVRVDLPPTDATLVTPGMKVELVAEAINKVATATVALVGPVGVPASADGTAGTPPASPVTVRPDRPLDGAWLGQDVRATFTSARTAAAVLVVPEAAITTAADGSTRVTVHAAAGDRAVVVAAGASGDGYVEVTPTVGSLSAGDAVLVGQ